MYDAFSSAQAVLEQVCLPRLERMADWTRWGYSVAEAIGGVGEEFLEAYGRNRNQQNREALDSHLVGAAVMLFMQNKDSWNGTPSSLLDELNKVAIQERIIDQRYPPRLWPKTAVWLTRRLHEVESNLRSAGITYSESHGKVRTLHLATETCASAVSSDVTGGAVDLLRYAGFSPDTAGAAKENGVAVRSTDMSWQGVSIDDTDGSDGIPGTSRISADT